MEKVKNYATAIYQNTMTGIQSIRDIESAVKDEELKKELHYEVEKYNEIRSRLEEFASREGVTLAENTFFEKVRLVMSIKMSTLTDKSTRHIAEMLLLGTVMGLTTCYKDQSDHENISEELDSILAKLEAVQEDNYSRLKKFLKKLGGMERNNLL